MKTKLYILIILINFITTSFGQISSFSDFKKIIYNSSSDSTFMLIDERLILLKSQNLSDSKLVETLKLKKQIADSLKLKIISHYSIEELLKYDTEYSLNDKFNYLLKEGDYQINIGGVDVSTEYHFKAVVVAEKLKSDSLLIMAYRRIGINYKKAQNYKLSIKYLNLAKNKAIAINDSIKIASCFMSIGNNYKDQYIFDSAMVFYNKSIALSKKTDWKSGLAGNYNNIGTVYRRQKDLEKSLQYYNLAIKMNLESGNQKWLSYNYNNIGNIYEDKLQYRKALMFFEKSQKIKEIINDKYGMLASYSNMATINSKIGKYKKAYYYLKKYTNLKDSLNSQSKQKMSAELEAKFQNEKKESEITKLISEQNFQASIINSQKKDLLFQEKLRNKEKYLRIAFGIILLSLLSTVFIFWKNGKERKTHLNTISESKKVLDIKNKEITDSINYTQRIQAAILPSLESIKTNHKESFILYLPKDIVAGDFYWTEKTGNTVYFAVADCTGHGVPGAMVSVVCNNALNLAMKSKKNINPGQILDETSVNVKLQFNETSNYLRDGMDIALCAIDYDTLILKYAGANNPIWIVRNGNLIEYKATRQPIGNYEKSDNFLTTEIQLKKDDIIYLSTDGFADQFGGEKGKKFMKKNFKNLLILTSKLPLSSQKQKLNNAFKEWRLGYDQIDDVCVMGVKI